VIADAIRSLYRYNDWANRRILDTSARVTRAQLLDSGAGFDSLRDTLVHTMSAQWVYLERWHDRTPRGYLPAGDFPDLAAIRARWETIERDTQGFVARLTDADLGRVVAYTNMQGERWAYPLWQQMIHQVNHATQHRSEAAMMLTKLDCSPGLLDLLYFVDVEMGGPDMAPHTPPRSSRPGGPGARLDSDPRSSRPGEPGARLDSDSI